MREIKFRAWNSYEKIMLWAGVHDRNWCSTPFNDENGCNCNRGKHPDDAHKLNLMQYTGLKDKNGVEIYEGDILWYKEKIVKDKQAQEEKWIVKFGEWECSCGDYYCSEGGMGFYVEGFDRYYRVGGKIDTYSYVQTIMCIRLEHNRSWSSCEVIGNIYENPELKEDT